MGDQVVPWEDLVDQEDLWVDQEVQVDLWEDLVDQVVQ